MVRWMSGWNQLAANESDSKMSRGFESPPHRIYGTVAVRWNTGPGSWLERPDSSGRSGIANFQFIIWLNMYWYVYILEMKNWKYYIGSTNNLERRFAEHQRWNTISTRNNRPLKLLYSRSFATMESAHQKELWLKKQKSKKIIQEFMAL